jgi:type I restriction enzyme M protein
MNIKYTPQLLLSLGFKIESGKIDFYTGNFNGNLISVDFESNKIIYPLDIKIHRHTTTNLNNDENLVVLECVCRLLQKGYNSNDIELEKSWNLGHKGKGFLDIIVKDNKGNSLFMIECKTWGTEFNKEKNKMFKDGGQLLGYFRQDRNPKALCLYSSKLQDEKIIYTSEIIDTKNLVGNNDEEIFSSWDNTFNKKGIFENEINVYDFKNIGLSYSDLDDLGVEDGKTIFNQFAEILRRHIVSDKPNAFNKIFNLFICKIQDEDSKFDKPNEDLDFQVKPSDTAENLFDRLNTLYKTGLANYIDIILPDINEKEFEELLNLQDNEKLKAEFRNLRYYRSSQEFAFKDVFNKETFEDNAEVVKEVVKLLQKFKIKYSKKHQHLGDFFELLLNTGFKQESGQFFTPIPITKFICKSLPIEKIINNKLENDEYILPYVLDYASGSGHFITEMMDEIDVYVNKIEEKQIKKGRKAINTFKSHKENLKWAKEYVYAIEKDYRLVKISKISSFLNGDGDANVISADGLASFTSSKYKGILHKKEDGKENAVFDILVANPPYSVSGFKNTLQNGKDCFELYNSLTDKSSEIEALFIERTKQLIKEGGVCGIILPISILTNGGIYEKTREILLNNFTFKAIVSLGSSAFMATGTKTIILFLEKQNWTFHAEVKKTVEDFLNHFKDVACNNIKNAFSTYSRNVYEMDLEDYTSILKATPTEKALQSELYKEYKNLSKGEVLNLEKEKLIYFCLTYSQKIILADSCDGNIEKEFYGYSFSNRRGSEGIHILEDEDGKLKSKLYNEDFEELYDSTKLNSYILRNFNEDKTLENEIAEIQVSESHPLKEHIHYLRLSSLMTFDLKRFDKSINLNKRNDFKIESKFEARPLESFVENIFDGFAFESKNLSAKKENDSFLPVIKIANVVNDIGIKTNFEYHELTKDLEKFIINKNDILLSLTGGESNVAKIALYKEEQKCLLNQRVGAIRIENDVSRKYVYLFLSTYFSRYAQIKSHGTVQKNYSLKLVRDFQIPIPPIEVQEKIVAEILQIEAQEETAKATIQKNEEKIKSLFGKGEKVKLTNIALMIKRGKSPQYGFSSVQIIKSGQVRGMYNFDFSKKYFVNKEFILDDRKLESGDILINSTGVGTAGRVNLFNLQGDFVVDSHITIIRLDKAKVLPKFALYELYSIGFDTIEKMANGQSGQIELSKETIENILINLPSVAEQENIIKQIEPLEKEIEEAKTFLSKSKEQKQEVLNKYLI